MLNIVFIGQNSKFTFVPLHEVSKSHSIIGIVESAPRNFRYDMLSKFKKSFCDFSSEYSLFRYATENNVPYYFLTKDNHKGLLDFLKNLNPDVICIASMSQLLKKEALDIPKYGVINFHPSLLPKYRGPDPWFW